MDARQCEKCGETVEATKAFCPGCGSAMVAEEVRGEISQFDATPGTIQYGKTMYGKVLSEMGLNISAAPNKAAPPRAAEVRIQATETAPAKTATDEPPKSSKIKWIILGVVLLLFVGLVVVAVAAVLIFLYFRYQQTTI